ncbi:MAG: uroporphyrinogen decarboxylase/cobalamine-independent methonine synthase family protein [Mycobacteriales bacterium]
MSRTWPVAAATGTGSLPGEDILAALAWVFDELADLPYLPELPERGPGADITGRALAHLADMHADLQPSGWRLVARPSHDERRARSLLAADLDGLEAVAAGFGGWVKVQVAGPWTLAAAVELPRGNRALCDRGATTDLIDSLAAGLGELVADLHRRLPQASPVVQLDEPGLPAALGGSLTSASGFATLPAITEEEARTALSRVVGAVSAAGGSSVAHCCAARPPVSLLAGTGVQALSLDLTVAGLDEQALGEFVEGGGRLIAGSVPALDPPVAPSAEQVARPVAQLWHRFGFDPQDLAAAVSISPTCGLSGASPGWAIEATRLAVAAARLLAAEPVAAGEGP